MEKDYMLKEIDFFGIKILQIIYNFRIEKTNSPTRWIKIILHHTGKNKTIQDIINLHVKKNRWSGIGYHFLISRTGKIYSSRSLSRAGAHTYLYNKNSIGIALLGNYDEETPTEKQLEQLKLLTKTLTENFPIKTILGHNQAIYKLLKEKYWKSNLEDKNILEIQTKLSYDLFQQKITTKILEENSEHQTISLIKRLKTCPGFNLYKPLLEIQKEFKSKS